MFPPWETPHGIQRIFRTSRCLKLSFAMSAVVAQKGSLFGVYLIFDFHASSCRGFPLLSVSCSVIPSLTRPPAHPPPPRPALPVWCWNEGPATAPCQPDITAGVNISPGLACAAAKCRKSSIWNKTTCNMLDCGAFIHVVIILIILLPLKTYIVVNSIFFHQYPVPG